MIRFGAGVGNAGIVRALLMSGSAAAALCAPVAASAQDDAARAAEAAAHAAENQEIAGQALREALEDSSTGNAIIVTATKREQTLQDTPVAVSVTTAETIERGQIRDLRDLQTVVPSLSVGQRQAVGSTNFFIRGFGNGANNVGIEPSVGVFVDGVYRSKTVSQITDLPDVQRIEVLRGPQSTLFGKNASAGVISITTQEPQFDFGGSVEATYGNYDQMIVKGLVTGPLSDSAAVSFAAGMNKRDGFFRDVGTGDRTNERDRWFVRGQFLLEGGDAFRARLIADYDSIDENCCAVVNLQDGLATPAVRHPLVGGDVNLPADRFDNVVYNNFNSTNDIENYGVSAPRCILHQRGRRSEQPAALRHRFPQLRQYPRAEPVGMRAEPVRPRRAAMHGRSGVARNHVRCARRQSAEVRWTVLPNRAGLQRGLHARKRGHLGVRPGRFRDRGRPGPDARR